MNNYARSHLDFGEHVRDAAVFLMALRHYPLEELFRDITFDVVNHFY